MNNCENCKHFMTSPSYPAHLGFCMVQLPPWLSNVVGPLDSVDKVVRKDAICDLHSKEQSK